MSDQLLFWKTGGLSNLVFGDSPDASGAPVDLTVDATFADDAPPILELKAEHPDAWNAEGLVFYQKPSEDQTLRFGWRDGTAAEVIPSADFEIDAEFAEGAPNLLLRYGFFASVDADFVDDTEFTVVYSSNTARPTVHRSAQCHQSTQKQSTQFLSGQQGGTATPVGAETYWQPATPMTLGAQHLLPDVLKHRPFDVQECFQAGEDIRQGAEHIYEMATPISQWRQHCHQQTWPLHTFLQDLWQERQRLRAAGEQQHQDASPQNVLMQFHHQVGTPLWVGKRSCYQWAIVLPVGKLDPFELPENWVCVDSNKMGLLVFDPEREGLGDELLFICDRTILDEDGSPIYPDAEKPAQIIVPVRKVYHVMNEVKVFKVASGAELPVQSISLDLDMASWAWGFNMKLPLSVLPDVMATNFGEPVELLASVNNHEFLLLAEKVTRSRMFGKTFVELSGRGHSAYLAAPYSPVLNHSIPTQKTAQQLTRDLLTTNGVSIGWNINWGITDWLLPAGCWSTQGTYMDGVRDIAKAVGAFVLPHRTEKELTIKPQYPHLPWNWGSVSPEFEIPTDVVETESVQWMERPEYNSVYVSGVSQGVVGWVRKGGTAGELQAPMKTHGLITHADAARMAGSAILSDTGRMANIKLSLPVLPETGIIDPGQMVRYTEGGRTIMGLTRAVQVSMREMPKLRQTIEVVTYV